MAKALPVWSLDIGQAALKALKLVPGPASGLLLAEAFDYIEYPKILSQPDADAEELVREALQTFLSRNDLKGCRVVLGVSGQAGLVKFIKLPPVDKARIPDIVKFEARQQIPFALEEVIWDYQQIGVSVEGDDDDEEVMPEVGLFAMKREQIQRALIPLRIAGIEVDIVQMNPIALYNFAQYDRFQSFGSGDAPEADAEAASMVPGPEAVDGALVVLDIGADHTDLIISDGTRIWQRNVPIGGNNFTRVLTKELKVTFAKAEHIKKNPTQHSDPKQVFTAMRAVFTEFSNEVNRSIGFYGSINRGAKVGKIIGLGNGFRLPGLPKFLQQNLGIEVEKLENFRRVVNDEVIKEPRFIENLPSFAVCYGLATQGLDVGQMRTNLLPPEIKKARMIRRKKPWMLAAAALMMVGFGGLFLGDWRVWSTVLAEPFVDATKRAESAAGNGKSLKSQYDTSVSNWNKVKSEGESLLDSSANRGQWAKFLQKLNDALPNPVKERGLNPGNPNHQGVIAQMQVHIDEVLPVWREDLAGEWFSLETDGPTAAQKRLMHPVDKDAPSGAGWVIQVVGHHYNSDPKTTEQANLPPDKKVLWGPERYLVEVILSKFAKSVELRQFGFSHFALKWFHVERNWTSEMALANNGLSATPPPLLKRFVAKAAGGGEGMAGGGRGMMGPGMMGGPGMSDMNGDMSGAMSGGMGPYGGRGDAMGMPGMGGPANKKAEKGSTLVRTDFLIMFAWSPATPEKPEKPREEIEKAIKEAEDKDRPEDNKSVDQLINDLGDEQKKAQEDAAAKAQEAAKAQTPKTDQPPAGAAAPAGATTPPPAGATTPPPAGATTPPPAGAATPPAATPPPAGATTPPPAGAATPPAATPPPAGATTPPPAGAATPPAAATPPPAGGAAAPAGPKG